MVKHNHLNRASYSLTLDERRLILSSIALLNPREPMPDEVTIHASDFAHQWGINPKYAYDQLKSVRGKLQNRLIKTKHLETGEVWEISWLDASAYQDGEGYIKLSFGHRIKPYLTELKSHFTSYHLMEIREFKSSHAIRLYELMMQYKNTGWMGESVDELKEMFNVVGKYTRWVDFKKNVLDVSIKEINAKTNYTIKYELVRRGRKITHVDFTFARNEQGDMFKPPN